MEKYFDNVKKNFGFGCMRLPMKRLGVDYKEFSKMIDLFMSSGFNYFDTAKIYTAGKSEIALRECLVKRYPREDFVFVDKLTSVFFRKESDIRPLFEKQLKACGLEYFDFYLMHAQNAKNFKKYKKCHAYETAFDLKTEGKIKHVGISFHDKASVLEDILTEYPQIEVVQIQFNYVDYEDDNVESRKCYEVCRKHDKPVIVMEPVKGGSLIKLPEKAQAIFDALHGGSNASYAIRFAAGFEGIMMVLSGMSNMEQMRDNLSFMTDFEPLDEKERAAVDKVCALFKKQDIIPCTACRYCTDGCPKQIPIPEIFTVLNAKKQNKISNGDSSYSYGGGKASDCIKCGKCESACPQHLEIRKLLEQAANELERQ